jgi:CHAT domain
MAFRISFKIGGRVQVNYAEVLPVTLAIYDREGQMAELVSFLAPLPQSLAEKFTLWQQCVGAKADRKVIKEANAAGVFNLAQLTDELKIELNQWLGEGGWIDEYGVTDSRVEMMLERLRLYLTIKDEVQIIIQTEDQNLRGLPWQEWDALASYTSKGVEVAIGATNFQRIRQKKSSQMRATARILVVFGDQNLGFEAEQKFIENLRQYGAEPVILKQPTRLELETSLKDPQGWHIFFFAGHSESDTDKQFGRFQINAIDDEQGVIEIMELRDLLGAAIENKLQLAIFNSCDGLGLANQLTQLSLPYCIVMREMVESAVAKELLRHFLAAFVQDRSLFASMNVARRQLDLQFLPGTSWLPVIVANPLAPELTWNRLFSERRLAWQWELLLGMLAVGLLVCLPVSMYIEFHGWDAVIFYAQLYPHITVYPSLFLWISLFASYRAHCMIRVKTRPFVICSLVTIFITLGALFFELSGDRMMLLEFKPNAKTVIEAQQLPQLYTTWKTSSEELASIPLELFDIRGAFDAAGNLSIEKSQLELGIKNLYKFSDKSGFQGLLRVATSHQAWQYQMNSFSFSRWMYILNVSTISAYGIQILALVSTALLLPGSIFNKNRYLTYLIVCELGILLWLPFRNYNIENINSLLFSYDFRGALVGSNFIALTMILILFLLTIEIVNKNATKKYRPMLFFLLWSSLVLTSLISLFGVSAIDRLFGMGSTNSLAPWFSGIIFFAPLFFLLRYWIDLHVGDE